MGTAVQDLRYALRILRKSPAFTLVAVLTLALGIGANSAIFSVVNGVLLHPLPYQDPGRLMRVYSTNLSQGQHDTGYSPPDFYTVRQRNHTFASISAFYPDSFNLAGAGEPQRLSAGVASADFFSTLGVKPAMGRAFLPNEEQFGSHRVVILSDDCWRMRLGADPQIVGKSLNLNGHPYTVVGVLPRGFYFFRERQIWVPMSWKPGDNMNSHNNYFLTALGRLKPGVTGAQAFADLNSIMAAIAERFPENKGIRADLLPLREAIVGEVRPALLVLLGAVGFVLLIACVNLANLLLARAAARQKEIAIRTALGATRKRLVRQFVTESVLLSLVGGGLGLGLAVWALAALPALSTGLPRSQEIRLDLRVLLFTVVVSIVAGILFGLAPALHGSRLNVDETLKEGGRTSTVGRGGTRLRSIFVISEVALAVILLAGSALMLKSFARLRHVNPGFDPQNVLTFEIDLPNSYVPGPNYFENGAPPRIAAFHQQLISRLAAIPGVKAVGDVSSLPLQGENWGKFINFTDRAEPTSIEQVPLVQYRAVYGAYFRALGIPLVKGRSLQASDTKDTPPVAVINQALARRYWPNQDAIGKQLMLSPPENLIPKGLLPAGYEIPRLTVVGVVDDVHYGSLNEQPLPAVYASLLQADWQQTTMVTVRAAGDPAALIGALRNAVGEIDRDLPLANIATMEELMASSVAQPRLETLLLGIFGGLAMVLATVGIYGVMSYSVAQRTHEIGIRVALGAARKDVLVLIVGQGFRLVVIGLLLGLASGLVLTRALTRLLFGVSPRDPFTFAAVPVLLAGVALLACYVPARRATKVDPMHALRYE